MNLSERSYEKELLDRFDIPREDIRLNMKELEFINKYLGGHKITLAGIKGLLANYPRNLHQKLTICEVGCGGGDNLLAIHKWCGKNGIQAHFIGIDINPFCIEVATEKLAGIDASIIASDYIEAELMNEKPDYIFTSLFCHHFPNEELVRMLGWMQLNAKKGFFINDLHRNKLSYYSIKLLTKFFSKSYLVKNDAPLSVLRSFKRKEWVNLLNAANISHYSIQWKWAFRHLVTVNVTM